MVDEQPPPRVRLKANVAQFIEGMRKAREAEGDSDG